MFDNGEPILAIRGPALSAAVAHWVMLGEKLLRIDVQGMVTEGDIGIIQKLYNIVASHRRGMVIICIDGLLSLDDLAENCIHALAFVAKINRNAIHIVVGESFMDMRVNRVVFGSIAHLHKCYSSFLERNSW